MKLIWALKLLKSSRSSLPSRVAWPCFKVSVVTSLEFNFLFSNPLHLEGSSPPRFRTRARSPQAAQSPASHRLKSTHGLETPLRKTGGLPVTFSTLLPKRWTWCIFLLKGAWSAWKEEDGYREMLSGLHHPPALPFPMLLSSSPLATLRV